MSEKSPAPGRRKKLASEKTQVAEKWGEAVAERGFAQVPYYLLHLNRFLSEKLSSLQILILIQLVSNWWEKGENPFPSMRYIAERCGVSERQVQRCIDDMVKREILKKEQKISPKGVIKNNSYNMENLVTLLNEVASAHPRISK